jgi:hypothetical protein
LDFVTKEEPYASAEKKKKGENSEVMPSFLRHTQCTFCSNVLRSGFAEALSAPNKGKRKSLETRLLLRFRVQSPFQPLLLSSAFDSCIWETKKGESEG